VRHGSERAREVVASVLTDVRDAFPLNYEAGACAARAGVSDDLQRAIRAHFMDEELVSLTMAVIASNGWNRTAIGLCTEVGSYRPATRHDPTQEHASPAAR